MSTRQQEASADQRRDADEEADRKSTTVRLRARDSLRHDLEKAARASGRSLSEEAEKRLINSFLLEPVHMRLYNNGHNAYQMFNSIMTAVDTIKEYAIQKFGPDVEIELGKNPALALAVHEAVSIILNKALAIEVPADINAPPGKRSQETDDLIHMREFGRLVGMTWTGQAKSIMDLVMRHNDSNH